MGLDSDDFANIRSIVSAVVHAELVAPLRTDRILTSAEAMAYTKHGSTSAFARWAKRVGYRSVSNGRHSRAQLDVALGREARKARF